jgi:hypothetical protein
LAPSSTQPPFTPAPGGLGASLVALAGFQVGEGQAPRAVDQAGQQRRPLRRRPGARHQPAGQAHVVEQGLDHQGLAAGFHRGHQVDRAAAEAAVGLGQGDGGQAHLGKGGPHLGAAAAGRLDDGLALLEVVVAGQVLADESASCCCSSLYSKFMVLLAFTDPGSSWR